MLRALSGREHQVLTAVALALRDQMETQISVSSVWFRELADAEIRRYVASGEPLDKAGAYAIQGRGGGFVAADRGQLFGYHGPAAVRDGRAPATVRYPVAVIPASLTGDGHGSVPKKS